MKANIRLVRSLWLLPALGILTLIVGAGAFMLWGAATYGTLSDLTGRVLRVDTNSLAERGGLQVGDVILSLNDCPPAMWDGYRHPLYRPGDVATLTFQRGDRVYTTAVPAELVPMRRWLAQLMVLLVALAFCLLSLVVLLSRPEAMETRRFYLMCQLWAVVLAGGTLSTVGVKAASRWFGPLNALLTPTMIHFHAVFPERRWLARRRRLTLGAYALGAALMVLFWLEPLLPGGLAGATQTVMYIWLLLGLTVAVGLMVTAYVMTSSPYARRRIRLVVFGTVLGFAPFGVLTAGPIALFGGATWDSWMLTIPLMSIVPIAYAVALWQHSLMGFDRVLNRGLVYLLVSAVFFGIYFIVLTIFYALLPVDKIGSAALSATVALVAAIAFGPLRQKIQLLVDRLFYGGWYDYRRLTKEMGRALARALDPETLVEVLVHRVPRAMHLPGATLWLGREEEMELVGRAGVQFAKAQAWLQEGMGVVEQGEVRVTEGHALVPLVVEDQKFGVWGLRARLNEEWGPEDRDILMVLGRHAALAAQSVRLVGVLRAKVAEVEEMHRRLLATREDERAGLARELHDGVIQDLIGLRYRLEAFQEERGDQSGQLGEIYTQVGLLIDELRRLCSDLRPLALDQLGLAAALRTLVREVTAWGLQVDTHLEDVPLPDSVAIGLYRIGREALSNVWRHAEAARATLTLMRESDEVVLTVTDDGRGFVPTSSWGRDACFGLLGMSERAEALGGHLLVESAPGEGTQVTVRCGLYAQPLCTSKRERHGSGTSLAS